MDTLNSSELDPKNMKILVVEDNAINQKVIRIILEKNEFEYELANDGLEAIEKYNTGKFSIILMDCQMPNLDGLEASRKIRELESAGNRGRCAIVAMTANAMKGDSDKCREAGMDDFLSKPFKSQDLIQILHSWRAKISQ